MFVWSAGDEPELEEWVREMDNLNYPFRPPPVDKYSEGSWERVLCPSSRFREPLCQRRRVAGNRPLRLRPCTFLTSCADQVTHNDYWTARHKLPLALLEGNCNAA
jgi:hypothetical protein